MDAQSVSRARSDRTALVRIARVPQPDTIPAPVPSLARERGQRGEQVDGDAQPLARHPLRASDRYRSMTPKQMDLSATSLLAPAFRFQSVVLRKRCDRCCCIAPASEPLRASNADAAKRSTSRGLRSLPASLRKGSASRDIGRHQDEPQDDRASAVRRAYSEVGRYRAAASPALGAVETPPSARSVRRP